MTLEPGFQFVIVYALFIGTQMPRLEPVYVSERMPLPVCERLLLKTRAVGSKELEAFCL